MADKAKTDSPIITGIKIKVLPSQESASNDFANITDKERRERKASQSAVDHGSDINYELRGLENIGFGGLKVEVDKAGLREALLADYKGDKEAQIEVSFTHPKKKIDTVVFEATPASVENLLKALKDASVAGRKAAENRTDNMSAKKFEELMVSAISTPLNAYIDNMNKATKGNGR